LDVANTILRWFNVLAGKLNFNQLTETSIREALEDDIAKQHSVWLGLARVQALADFGDERDCRAAYSQLSRELHNWRKKTS
jgi:hypothetical protein